LASTDGPRWHFLRHELNRFIFSSRVVASYIPYINPICADVSKLIAQQPDHITCDQYDTISPHHNINSNKKSKVVNVEEITPYFTCETMASVLFGIRLGSLTNNNGSQTFAKNIITFFSESFTMVFDIPWWRLFLTPRFKRYLNVYQSIRQYALAEVHKCMTDSHDNNCDSNSENGDSEVLPVPYIKRLIKENKLSEAEMTEGIVTMFIAGVDATASAIDCFLLQMAINTQVQDKLYNEIYSVLHGGDYHDSALTQLTYLKWCIKELYRLMPAVPGTFRSLRQDVVLHTGQMLKRDTTVFLCPSGVLQDDNYVSRPTVFDPQRWSDDNRADRTQAGLECVDTLINYVPFSFGPRMCLGAKLATVEMYCLLCRLFQDYRITLSPDAQPYTIISIPFAKATPYPKLVFTPRS